MHQTIIFFDNGIFNTAIENTINTGLDLIQASSYNILFHLLVCIICNLTFLVFIINLLYKYSKYQIKTIKIIIDYLFIIISFFFNISPAYLIIMVYHVQYLFVIPVPALYYYFNLLSLPCYLIYFGITFFLKRKTNIINLLHLIVPIFDFTLQYDGVWFNLILLICGVISFLIIDTMKLVIFSIIFRDFIIF